MHWSNAATNRPVAVCFFVQRPKLREIFAADFRDRVVHHVLVGFLEDIWVPLFIHAPGVSRDGVKTRQPATLTDLYPTLCELAGLPIPAQCDGASLVPLLKNPTTTRERLSLTSFVFARETAPSHAVSDPRYRFIRYGNGFEELYDLETDPNEFTNRAADPALAAIKARLALSLPANPAASRGAPAESIYNLRKGSPAAKKKAAAANPK